MNAQGTTHSFIAIDEGLGTLLRVDQNRPERDWTVPIGHPQARDMQLIGGGRILIGHDRGYTEFDVESGKKAKELSTLGGVTSVRRQADGTTLIAGVNVGGIPGVAVHTLDPKDTIIRTVHFQGDYVRLIRQDSAGNYLMCCNDRIREASPEGQYLRDYPVEGFLHAWKAVKLANGHLMVSAGYGSFMVELAADGGTLRNFGAKDSVPQEVQPNFYAMFQVLPSGNLVVANWQGHGPGHGGQGIQLLEFDPAGNIVWTWSQADRISSLQGILVLDGLDLELLHDERTGILRPSA